MTPAIELQKLSKLFEDNRGVHELSLIVPSGQIYGFLGPNGAGKTTTISMLINLIRPTSGEMRLFDKPIGISRGAYVKSAVVTRKDIGFLTSDMPLDPGLTGWQQLEFFGNVRGQFNKTYISHLAKRLDCDLNRKFKRLSRGNKQKVALIAALMHKPKLLLLDEPTSGLDPIIQAEFNKIILEHKAAGSTAFISSHMLSEVQELCDHVVFIRDGKIAVQKSMAELTAHAPKQVRIITEDHTLINALQKLSGVNNIRQKEGRVDFAYTSTSRDLVKLLAKHTFSDLAVQDTELEQVFLKYYEDEKK
jgi:ABC-2 type transport system ATP-binding protein